MYRARIIDAGLEGDLPICGLSPEQIAEIEAAQGVIVPSAYRDFLLECGESAGLLCDDAEFFYPALKYLKQDLQEILNDDDEDVRGFEFDLPPNALVIGSYQGRQHDYLICDGTNDPPVHRLVIMKGSTQLQESFTSYIARMIGSYQKAQQDS